MTPSTSTMASPLPSPAISPVTITLQEMSTPPAVPVCVDATSDTNPLGRLRSAMRNSGYTQMTPAFDAFIVFFSDEHLVSNYLSSCDSVIIRRPRMRSATYDFD